MGGSEQITFSGISGGLLTCLKVTICSRMEASQRSHLIGVRDDHWKTTLCCRMGGISSFTFSVIWVASTNLQLCFLKLWLIVYTWFVYSYWTQNNQQNGKICHILPVNKGGTQNKYSFNFLWINLCTNFVNIIFVLHNIQILRQWNKVN